jgi:hypothetical protein
MNIEIKAETQLTPAERQDLERLSAEAFPPDGDPTEWNTASDWHVLVREDDRVVSHIEVLDRTIRVDGQPLRVGGIGGVATLKAWRRRGLAEAAMKTA